MTTAHWVDHESMVWIIGEFEVPLSPEATTQLLGKLFNEAHEVWAKLIAKRPAP